MTWLWSLEIFAAWLALASVSRAMFKAQRRTDALANERIVFDTRREHQHVQAAQHGDQGRSRVRCGARKGPVPSALAPRFACIVLVPDNDARLGRDSRNAEQAGLVIEDAPTCSSESFSISIR